MEKHWYDYLWIVSLAYLILGFFNILFAWIGLLCFFIPLIISLAKVVSKLPSFFIVKVTFYLDFSEVCK